MVDIVPEYSLFASSMNVELVYIILKSITAFQYVCNSGALISRKSKNRIILLSELKDEDTIL